MMESYYIIEGANQTKTFPYALVGEYYQGKSYFVQGENYAVFDNNKETAKRYSSYSRAFRGTQALLNKCRNVSFLKIVLVYESGDKR